MKRRLYLLNCLSAALLLSGCAGYRLSGASRPGVGSVALGPVANETGESAVEIQVTHAMRSRIQFDGRLELAAEPARADAVLEITLTALDMKPIAYKTEEGDSSTPDLYRLRLTGTAELRDTETGEVISKTKTYGESTFEFQSDLTTSKRIALPDAAEELAKFMLDDLIESWK